MIINSIFKIRVTMYFQSYLGHYFDLHQSTPLTDVHLTDTCAHLYSPTQTYNKFRAMLIKSQCTNKIQAYKTNTPVLFQSVRHTVSIEQISFVSNFEFPFSVCTVSKKKLVSTCSLCTLQLEFVCLLSGVHEKILSHKQGKLK